MVSREYVYVHGLVVMILIAGSGEKQPASWGGTVLVALVDWILYYNGEGIVCVFVSFVYSIRGCVRFLDAQG